MKRIGSTLVAAAVALTLAASTFGAGFLSMQEARKQANIFARHGAVQADDDGYRVGKCSRFSSVNVHCSAHSWGYREKKGYEYDCYYTIVIRLQGDTIDRSQRHNRCYTR